MTEKLTESKLLRDLDPEVIDEVYSLASVKRFAKGDVVATQGTRMLSLLLLTEGQLHAEATGKRGEKMSAEVINAPAPLVPASLFTPEGAMPATLTARGPVSVLSIPREQLLDLMQRHRQLLRNFLEVVCSPEGFVSERTIYLGCKTIKGKIARYLLDVHAREKGPEFNNPLTQREMADLFGVTRPALARAMGEMSAEGAVFIKGKKVKIIFTEKLKQYIK